ncbi:hypothetical protein JCM10369A_36480 [Nocardioides pyridinolyticus]
MPIPLPLGLVELDRPRDPQHPQGDDERGHQRDRQVLGADLDAEGADVGEHDQAARGDAEDAGGEVADQGRGDRGGDDAAEHQCGHDGPLDALAAERGEEAEGGADGDDDPGRPAVELDEERRSRERTDESRDGEDADRAPVHVAERVVGDARDERGPDLGEVDRGAGRGGPEPAGDQQRGGVTP